jgi:hypothetical protein
MSNTPPNQFKAVNQYQTTAGPMIMGADGIIRFRVSPGATVSAAKAQECIDGARELAGDSRHLLLIDMRKLSGITRDARRIYNDGAAFAVALLIGSPVSKVIGSFFLGLNKPSYPLRLFTSEQEAEKWLKDFID